MGRARGMCQVPAVCLASTVRRTGNPLDGVQRLYAALAMGELTR